MSSEDLPNIELVVRTPVIFDEVFVGLYRIGMESTGPLLGVYPDISVNAKILTGVLYLWLPRLHQDTIFQAFMSDKKLMHCFMAIATQHIPLAVQLPTKPSILSRSLSIPTMFNARRSGRS